jgi:hypothetical protein
MLSGLAWAVVGAVNASWTDAPLWFRVVSAAVGAAATWLAATKVTPSNDPRDGEGRPLTPN